MEWEQWRKNGCNTSRPSNIRDVVQRNALRCVHTWDTCFLDRALLYDFLTSKTLKRSIMRFQDPWILRCLLYTLFSLAIQIAVTSTDQQLPTLQIRLSSQQAAETNRRFFNIYGLQPTVPDLSPSGIYRATFRLPHHGNLKLCSWHIHSSNGLARWFDWRWTWRMEDH